MDSQKSPLQIICRPLFRKDTVMIRTLKDVYDQAAALDERLAKRNKPISIFKTSRLAGPIIFRDEVGAAFLEVMYRFNTHFVPRQMPGSGSTAGTTDEQQRCLVVPASMNLWINVNALHFARQYDGPFNEDEAVITTDQESEFRQKTQHPGLPFMHRGVLTFSAPNSSQETASPWYSVTCDDLWHVLPSQRNLMILAATTSGKGCNVRSGSLIGQHYLFRVPISSPFLWDVQQLVDSDASLVERWNQLKDPSNAMEWAKATQPHKDQVAKKIAVAVTEEWVLGLHLEFIPANQEVILRPLVTERHLERHGSIPPEFAKDIIYNNYKGVAIV